MRVRPCCAQPVADGAGLLKDPSALPVYPRGEAGSEWRSPAVQRSASCLASWISTGKELSRYTGDVLAHTLFSVARHARRGWGATLPFPASVGRIPDRRGPLAPGCPLEVASFNDDSEVLAHKLKAVELRLARFEQQWPDDPKEFQRLYRIITILLGMA